MVRMGVANRAGASGRSAVFSSTSDRNHGMGVAPARVPFSEVGS
jgi:hypothetical protein